MLTFDPQKVELHPGSSVLDVGCGQGRHAHALFQAGDLRVYGLELGLEQLQQARAGFKVLEEQKTEACGGYMILQGDCLCLPFISGSLQAIICCEVLEHLENYHRALLEMKRALQPGGTLVISVPRFTPERICWALSREYQLDPGGHLRIFQAKGLRLEIERLGFKLYAKHWTHALHTPYWWLQCWKWEQRESWPLIRLYHRFLVWDMFQRPLLTRVLERLLNPVLGKSLVLYFQKAV